MNGPMQINIIARHVELTPAIEEYVMKKAERLPRYFDRIEGIEIIIDKTHHDFEIEVISKIEHGDPIVAHSDSQDMYACIDQCMDRAVRQLSDHKSRLRDRKHNTGS